MSDDYFAIERTVGLAVDQKRDASRRLFHILHIPSLHAGM
jgi:hypothetical protein